MKNLTYVALNRVVDPDWLNTDPDPAFLLNPDPNPSKKQNFRRQFLSQILLKSKFESNQIKNTGVIHQIFFQKVPVVSAILYLFSGNIFWKNN
jgi:hypothetical protein